MARKNYKPEEIVAKLRQVDVLTSQGQRSPSGECRLAEFGGMGDAGIELELVIAQDRCLMGRLSL